MKISRDLCAIVLMLACGCSSRVGQECADSAGCGPSEYCAFEEGSCGDDGQAGVCAALSDACIEIFQPVCGCDGQTYSNDCVAAMAGVSVASGGECESEQKDCGGIAGVICDDGEYCKFDVGSCGDSDQSGVCEAIPDACDAVFDPVCGCDGVTYGNECEAAAAGASLMASGECETGDGCTSHDDCARGQFCILAVGDCLLDEPGAGTCFEAALVSCSNVENSVCGCDGETYLNGCVANVAGVSVAHEGACQIAVCCAVAEEPGIGDNPACIEGASCCADGEWKCNNGVGASTCDAPGTPFKADGNSRPKPALSLSDEGKGKSLE